MLPLQCTPFKDAKKIVGQNTFPNLLWNGNKNFAFLKGSTLKIETQWRVVFQWKHLQCNSTSLGTKYMQCNSLRDRNHAGWDHYYSLNFPATFHCQFCFVQKKIGDFLWQSLVCTTVVLSRQNPVDWRSLWQEFPNSV